MDGGLTSGLPTGRRGQMLALGLTALLLAAFWIAVAQPLLGWHAALGEAVRNRGAVARRMAVVAQELPELRRQAAAMAPTGTNSEALLDGATDALASAGLQVRVRDLASQAGISLASTETLPAEAAGGFRRIGVRIAATEPWPKVMALLQALDQANPRMLVDDLQLQSAPSLVGTTTYPLNLTLTVFAFRAATTPPATGATP